MLDELFLVNQALEFTIANNTDISESQFDKTLIDQVQRRVDIKGHGRLDSFR